MAALQLLIDVVIVSSSVANPTVITTATPHGFVTGDSVTISGHASSTPDLNGTHTVTKLSDTTFSIPENVSDGGTGGRVLGARKFRNLEITYQANEPDALRCTIISADRTYKPAKRANVYVVEDGTRIYGGTLTRPRRLGLGTHGSPALKFEIEAVSFKDKAKNRLVTLTTTAGWTLKQILTALESGGFLPSGVVVHPSQADGPTFANVLVWTDTELAAVLLQLAKMTGWVYDIDPDLQLVVFEPASTAAPYDITQANGKAEGEIAVDPSTHVGANQVVVKIGTAGLFDKTEDFVGDGVTDTFPLKYPISGPVPYGDGTTVVGHAVVDYDGGTESIGGMNYVPAPGQDGVLWEHDPTSTAGPFGTIRRISGAPPNGVLFSLRRQAQFPIAIRVPATPPSDVVEKVIYEPDVFDYDVGYQIGETALAIETAEPDTVEYKTREVGHLIPGMTQLVDVADRDIDDTVVVTEVVLRHGEGELYRRHVRAVTGDLVVTPQDGQIVASWLERGGSSASTPAAAGGSGIPGLPFTSLQFNRAGAFGGDPALLYDETNKRVTLDGAAAKVILSGNDAGTQYGPEVLRAALAAIADDDDMLALALGNAAAGAPLALTFWVLNDGSCYISNDVAISIFGGDIDLNASLGVDGKITLSPLSSTRTFAKSASTAGFYHRLAHIAPVSTSYTIDPHDRIDVYYFDPTAGTDLAVALPALNNSAVSTGATHGSDGRKFYIRNVSTTRTVTLAGDGSETIDGAATKVLQPGESCVLQACRLTGIEGWNTIGGSSTEDLVAGPATSTDKAVARFDGTTGKVLQDSPVTLSDAGAFTFPDGVRQTFNPDGTNAGLNVGQQAGDPSSLTNGDIWLNSTADALKARIDGVTRTLLHDGSTIELGVAAHGHTTEDGSANPPVDLYNEDGDEWLYDDAAA